MTRRRYREDFSSSYYSSSYESSYNSISSSSSESWIEDSRHCQRRKMKPLPERKFCNSPTPWRKRCRDISSDTDSSVTNAWTLSENDQCSSSASWSSSDHWRYASHSFRRSPHHSEGTYRAHRNIPPRKPVKRGALEELWCHWCGRKGHSTESCWERRDLCLRCGSESHKRNICPKNIYYRSKRTAFCYYCSGFHLGELCAFSSNNATCSENHLEQPLAATYQCSDVQPDHEFWLFDESSDECQLSDTESLSSHGRNPAESRIAQKPNSFPSVISSSSQRRLILKSVDVILDKVIDLKHTLGQQEDDFLNIDRLRSKSLEVPEDLPGSSSAVFVDCLDSKVREQVSDASVSRSSGFSVRLPDTHERSISDVCNNLTIKDALPYYRSARIPRRMKTGKLTSPMRLPP